ncbi:hypothetical protein AXF42_Ash005151 [Apostasia shenzhenica]|uniref:Phospholipid scramblase n=1 Tax=Apostasia shenzhenica TaxID=1088818 RepID=A0A2I0B8N9_9ASPA|nr:hypothetical protein AXF42_Ash005151 [Apostasia shenzhenica]
MHARFANMDFRIFGLSSFCSRGVYGSLTSAFWVQKTVHTACYHETNNYGRHYSAFLGQACSRNANMSFHDHAMPIDRILKPRHNCFHANILQGLSALNLKFLYTIRREVSTSSDWLAKSWLAEKRKKDMLRKRRRRHLQRAETKVSVFDSSFIFPSVKSFFARSIPAEQEWKANEAMMQTPIRQYDGRFHRQTPEEVKLAPLLMRNNLLITRDVEWANIMFAFEQENRYAVMDPCYPQSPVGFIREQSNVIVRQLLRTRRPFIAYISDAMGNELFRVRRPFWWITSTIYAEVNGKEVGVVRRRWHLWRRIYDLYMGNKQFAVVENPGFWNWTFTLKDEDDNVLAQIDRDWRGFGFELFTDAGQYVIRFGNAFSNPQISLASVVEELEVVRPLTMLERAVTVALAISLDNDFFSRTVGGWGLPIIAAGE